MSDILIRSRPSVVINRRGGSGDTGAKLWAIESLGSSPTVRSKIIKYNSSSQTGYYILSNGQGLKSPIQLWIIVSNKYKSTFYC